MSVRYRIGLSKIKLDEGKFTKALDKGINVLMRKAARAWLEEVILHVAVWSGETKGSLKFASGTNGNLARHLNLAIPINAPYPRPNKNQFTGKGRYNFSEVNGFYTFLYRSDVVQYELNEFYKDVSPTSPWHSIEKGNDAFHIVILEGMPKLPKIIDYIVKEYS